MTDNTDSLRQLVAEVSAAYFANSHVAPADIPQVVQLIATSLLEVGTGAQPGEAETEPTVAQRKVTPAQIRNSITPQGLISFEDGKTYKTLRRHLSGAGLTAADYRSKWGLPSDYPMTSPAYSELRSAMAKSLGFGRKPGASVSAPTPSPFEEDAYTPPQQEPVAQAPASEDAPAPAPRRRGRPPKAAAAGDASAPKARKPAKAAKGRAPKGTPKA